ncbi:6650_t:CDS:2, partial [Ambispora leptoticha]
QPQQNININHFKKEKHALNRHTSSNYYYRNYRDHGVISVVNRMPLRKPRYFRKARDENMMHHQLDSRPENLRGEYDETDCHLKNEPMSSNSESETEQDIKMELRQAGENRGSINGHFRRMTDYVPGFQETNVGIQPFDNSHSFIPLRTVGCGLSYAPMPTGSTVQVMNNDSEWSSEELQELLWQLLLSD